MAKSLSTSIVSSFDVGHFERNIDSWPHDVSCFNVDVYAFMHNCLEILFPNVKEPHALHCLAEAYETQSEVARIAKIVHSHFSKKQIAAFTSFLPEILAPEDGAMWSKAQDALKFLILVAARLRDEFGHPCNTLTMSGGSCYNGMWEGRYIEDDRDTVIVVNILSKEIAIRRLLFRLETVAELAVLANIRLAISMEPGPLYAIGDWNSILQLCSLIDSSSAPIKSSVGLNLDIAHWAFLSDITVKMVLAAPMVKSRIIHAHISDHDRGHCSDAKPGTFHKPEEFIPWIKLLKQLCEESHPKNELRLPFSGFVSCELESACHFRTVTQSIETVRSWVEAA